MIVDTSAVVAIFFREPAFEVLIDKLSASDATGIGTPTLAEAGIVLHARLKRDPLGLLARFLHEFGIVLVPFAEPHWLEAVDAYRRFGRGRHRAALNFGDCLSYATAKLAGRPLLCVGNDFRQTDLPLA